MKKTLLELVQKLLEATDADPVNSVMDTVESLRMSSIVEQVYYNFVTTRIIPEHKETIKLVAAADSEFPTHFQYPDRVYRVSNFWYDTSSDSTFEYSELTWLEPEEFLRVVDGVRSNYDLVNTKEGETKLRIINDKHPEYFTSFDDNWIVCNSYKSTIDSTLQTSKTRALVIRSPSWQEHTDDFIPDLDDNLFPLLLAEAKVLAQSDLHDQVSPVDDRITARLRAGVQDKKRKVEERGDWSIYGR